MTLILLNRHSVVVVVNGILVRFTTKYILLCRELLGLVYVQK